MPRRSIKKILKLLATAICITLVAVPTLANREDNYSRLRHALRSQDAATAITEIVQHGNESPYPLAYLRGLLAIDIGDIANAFLGFETAAKDDESELAAVSIARQASLAKATGNLLFERILLTDVMSRFPATRAGRDAKLRLAESSFDIGDAHASREALTRRTSNTTTDDKTDRRAKLLLADSSLRLGDIATAKPIYERFASEIKPDKQSDDVAIAAVRSLDIIAVGSDSFGKTAPKLTATEHLARGWAYLQERDLANAKLHYDAVIAIDPYGNDAIDSTLRIGRGYAQIGDHSEALKWYERLIERYPESAQAKEALLLSASAYARVGRPKEAITRYESYIERHPNDERLDRAYLNIVDINRDLGVDQEALKWCERTREAFRDGPVAAVATFTMARIRVARGEWDDAIKSLDELSNYSDLGGTKIPGGTTTSEVKLLRAFSLERAKRFGEAIDVYLSFAPTLSDHFAARSAVRIAEMSSDPAAAAEIAQRTARYAADLNANSGAKESPSRTAAAQKILMLSASPDLRQRATEILKSQRRTSEERSTDAFDQLLRERPSNAASAFRSIGAFADAAVFETTPPTQMSPEIAALLDRGDVTFAVGFDRLKKLPTASFESVDRATLRLAYPVPFRNALLRQSRASGVDPRFMLAIMRQESGFKADARSSVSARGLMQFMTPTAARSARRLAIEPLPIRDLYEPDASIMLGSVYLAELFTMFPNMPEAVAASYNGGEDNMKRWLARSRATEPERFVPEVMFTQSKDYVYRVMGNYDVYRRLYDENLRPIN